MSLFLIELAPGGRSDQQRHLFEEVIYVAEGHGSTTVVAHDGRKHTFEWGPKSLFALPLNATYQHFNGSGTERARLCSATDLPMIPYHKTAIAFYKAQGLWTDKIAAANAMVMP